MRSGNTKKARKGIRSLSAKFMILLMIINLFSGTNPLAVRADAAEDAKHFGNNNIEATDGRIAVNETAKDYDNGKFDVEMLIKGNGSTTVEQKNLDVVLVVDRSYDNMRQKGKMATAKKTASDLVDYFLKNGNGRVRVGLVSFAGNNVKSGNLADPMIDETPLTQNKADLKNNIKKYYSFGWSKHPVENEAFTQLGLIKANDMLSNPANKKIIVLISGGVPTLSYNKTKNGLIDPPMGYGKAKEVIENTVSEATKIKTDNNVDIFSVGISANDNAKGVLSRIASKDRYFDSNIPADVLNKVDESLKEIKVERDIEKGVLKVKTSTAVKSELNPVDITLSAKNIDPNATSKEQADLASRVNNIKKNYNPQDREFTFSDIDLGKNEVLTIKYKAELLEKYKDGNPYQILESATLYPKGTNVQNGIEFKIPTVKDMAYTSLTINKEWKGGAVPEGLNSVEFSVKADGTLLQNKITVAPDNAGKWSGKLENLPKYKAGSDIAYTVEEDAGNNYEKVTETPVANDGSGNLAVTVTNRSTEKVSVTATKKWVNTPDDIKTAVEVELYARVGNDEYKPVANAKRTIEKEDSANEPKSVTFTGLDKYNQEGQRIDYKVKEIAETAENKAIINGKNFSVTTEKNDNGWIITNTCEDLTAETIEVTLIKNWADGAGKKAEFIFTNTSVMPATEVKRVTLPDNETTISSDKKTWTKKIKLPKYNQGNVAAKYLVNETEIKGFKSDKPNGVTVTGDDTVTFTNTRLTRKLAVEKKWLGKEGNKAEFTLEYKGANPVKFSLPENGNWTKEFNLPVYDLEGNPIEYKITEDPLEGYKADKYSQSVNLIPETGENIDLVKKLTFTNTQLINITVEKKWENGVPAIAIQSVKFKITSDGKEYDLNEKNEWKKTLNNLPLYNKDGEIIDYSVIETEINGEKINVPDDFDGEDLEGNPFYSHKAFKITLSQNAESIKEDSTVTITNSITEPEQAEQDKRIIKVIKSWGKTPDDKKKSVEVTLYKVNEDGDLVKADGVKPIILKADSDTDKDWQGEFTVDRYIEKEKGQNPDPNKEEVLYYVFETKIGDEAVEAGLKLDPNLYNDGYRIGDYTVKISELTSGDDNAKTGDYGFYILNESSDVSDDPADTVEKVNIKVTKAWTDTTPNSYKLPVIVRLFVKNGEYLVPAGDADDLVLSEQTGWTKEFNGLDKFTDGVVNEYYVYEVGAGTDTIANELVAISKPAEYQIGKYNVVIAGNGTTNVVITNDHKPDPITGGGEVVPLPSNPSNPTDPVSPSNPSGATPETPVADPSSPTVDITADPTPEGTAGADREDEDSDETGIVDDLDEEDTIQDDTDMKDETDIDEDTTPQGTAKDGNEAKADKDMAPQGNTNLPRTGGTNADIFGLIGLGLVGLGILIKRRK